MDRVLSKIGYLLEQGRTMAWARIVRQKGSSSRTVGANCLILDDGTIIGTIGGGRLEYEVAKKTKDNFSQGRPFLQHFELTGAEVDQTEAMICGGTVDVYTEYLIPDNENTVNLFHQLNLKLKEGKKGVLLTVLAEGQINGIAGHAFIDEDGNLIDSIPGLLFDEEGRGRWLAIEEPCIREVPDKRCLFVEPIEPDNLLYLFGAGHISTCLAPLAKMVGFRVGVIDDREEFCNPERFPQADELLVVPFAEACDRIVVSSSSFLVIVTRGHVHDLTVLRAALRSASTPAYIGMIGSRRKIDMIYHALLAEGISRESLEKVHAPIGLDIGAESPEEIAVCITAELIQVRVSLRIRPD